MSTFTINFCSRTVPMSKARRYCGTINASLEALHEWRDLADQIKHQPKVRYFICQPEKAPTTGKVHIQWYVELTAPTTLTTVAAIVGQSRVKPHVERCRGSQAQNIAYVTKTDTSLSGEFPELVLEFGQPGKQGGRTDLEALGAECQKDDATIHEIADKNPGMFIRYHRGIEALLQLHDKPRPIGLPKKVLFFYGKTGTGKTRAAFEEAGEDPYCWGPEQGKWWNGYNRHSTVIMDEFRGQLEMGYMLRLLDVYPMKVETKGGMRQFVADTVIMTGPMHPRELYPSLGNDLHDQFLRRIDEVREF